ncbi:MAG: tetratricopeptide repeat protein [Bacteroidetes bacterium]|nr:tetratricopeptide repeat protein [Bacteroidota bacterium]
MTISRYIGRSWLAAFAAGIVVCSCAAPEPPPKHSVSLSKEMAARLFGTTGKADSAYRERRSREYFLRGSALQMEKRHAEAILDFQMALRFDSSAVTLYALAKNHAELERYDDAIEYARLAILRDSTFLPVLEIVGTSYLALGEFEKAIQAYEKLVELEPDSRQYRFMLARIFEAYDQDKAVAIYNALLEEAGGDERVLRRLAEIYRSRNDQPRYEAVLERLWAETGEQDVNEELIAAYCNSRDFDKALNALVRATVLVDSDDAARLFGAVGQSMLDAREIAATATADQFRRYLQIASRERFFDWQTNIVAGMVAYFVDDSTIADVYFDRAAIATNQSDAAFRIGIFYLQNGKYLRSATRFERYDSIFAESRFALYAGYTYAYAGDYGRAFGALKRGLERDSTNTELWAQAGLVLEHLGRTAESDVAYEAALKLEPDNAFANNNLAYSLATRGIELQRALALARKSMEIQPNNASFLDTYGWILFNMGNYDGAVKYLEKAIKTGNAGATIYEHLGDCYRKLGMNTDAVTAYRKALELAPERVSAATRLEELTK